MTWRNLVKITVQNVDTMHEREDNVTFLPFAIYAHEMNKLSNEAIYVFSSQNTNTHIMVQLVNIGIYL